MATIPYRLDWVAGILSLAGMYFVGKRLWWGWLVNIANLFLLFYINCHFRLWGFLPVNAAMLLLFCKNARGWFLER